jgi:hypothetical protein
MTCKGCSGIIDLASPENKLLIAGTEAHCIRLESALKKRVKALKQHHGKPKAKAPKHTTTRIPGSSGKKDTRATHIEAR